MQLQLTEMDEDTRIEEHQQLWARLAAGKFTSSQLHRLMGEPKSKAAKDAGELSETAAKYAMEKATQEIAFKFSDVYTTEAQEHGIAQESAARRMFERVTGKKVIICVHYLYNLHAGGAPDGEVAGENAIIEIKCPFNSGNHTKNLVLDSPNEISYEYQIQMQANMLFGKKQKCYFISYDDRLPSNLQLKIIEVPASPEIQQRIIEKLNKAIAAKENYLKMVFEKM